jgi:hypothetical protein
MYIDDLVVWKIALGFLAVRKLAPNHPYFHPLII